MHCLINSCSTQSDSILVDLCMCTRVFLGMTVEGGTMKAKKLSLGPRMVWGQL